MMQATLGRYMPISVSRQTQRPGLRASRRYASAGRCVVKYGLISAAVLGVAIESLDGWGDDDHRFFGWRSKTSKPSDSTQPGTRASLAPKKPAHWGGVVHSLSSSSSANCIESYSPHVKNKDPLNIGSFFDIMYGGTISKDYLPLMLLPDQRDSAANDAAMALNEFIMSFNVASPAMKDDAAMVHEKLRQLADQVTNCPLYQASLLALAEQYSANRFCNSIDRHKLKQTVADTQNSLISHVLARDKLHELEWLQFDGETCASKEYVSSAPKAIIELPRPPVLLHLELTLAKLVNALHTHSPVCATPYIEDARHAVHSVSSDLRAYILKESLGRLQVPDDVDVSSLVSRILKGD